MTASRELALASAALFACILVLWALQRRARLRYEAGLAASLGRAEAPDPTARWDARLARIPLLRTIERRLRTGRLRTGVSHVVLAWVVVAYPAFLLCQWMVGTRLGLILTVVAIPLGTVVGLGRLAAHRRHQFTQQSLDLVRHLAGSARAGLSVSHALASAAEELGDPMGEELRRVVLDIEFGKLPVTALEEFQTRSKLPEIDLLVDAVVIQQRSGGDLVSLLSRLANGMEAIGRGRREAEGQLASIKALPWTFLVLTLMTLTFLNHSLPGVLDRMWNFPTLVTIFYVALTVLVLVVPVLQRVMRLERTR